MTDCKDIQQSAAGLAMLPAGDPERQQAFAHAGACEACRTALKQGEQLAGMLALAPAPAPPTEAVLQRTAEAIHAAWDAERSWARLALLPLSLLIVFGALLAQAHFPLVHGGQWLHAAVVLGATVGLSLLLLRSAALSLGIALAASVGLSLFAGHQPFVFSITNGCFKMQLFAAALPLGATAFMVLRGRVGGGPFRLAAAAAVGSLAGQAAMHLACPGRELSHLFAAHTSAVIAAAIIGAVIGMVPQLRGSRV